MAAYAALVSLTNTIDHLTTHPRLPTFFDEDQIHSLQKSTASLLDFIGGYDYVGETSREVEDLERRIACAAHDAEDVIESHIFVQIHTGSDQPSLGSAVDLQPIIQDIEAIVRIASELKEGERLGSREEKEEEEQRTHQAASMEAGEATMVGFEEELIQIMDELTNQQSSRLIISIVGMGGLGKTTLARNVYENLLVKQHFDIRAWTAVSQQYNVRDVLKQLLYSRGESSSRTVDELGEQLHKTLYGRRYLIVLDDIWSVEAWDRVSRFLPDNRNRSRVVLTTRLSNLARDCCSSSSFAMKPLDVNTSWKLFCKTAFEQETCPYPELERVGKEIARLCRGLPLSTVVIGGLLLKSPRSLKFWNKVVKDIKSNPVSKEKEESLDILTLSYNNLPPHLKPCFLYMGVFKEDLEIRVTKIINLWISEGFLRPNNTHTILEEVGEGYVKELVDRNMILVSKRHKNGKTGSCGIHDLMRDLCFKVAKQQECLHSGPLLARSMCKGSTTVGPLISCEFLRVFNEDYLESSEILSWHVNLRYLAAQPSLHLLTGWKLPASISLMWNLQTLNITLLSYEAVVAPIEIWKMRQLRHVKCSNLDLPQPPPSSDGLFMMDNLQTLTTTVNLKVSEEVCKIAPNVKKLRIAYGDEWHGYDDSLMQCVGNLGSLHKLESLKLRVPNLDHGLNRIVTFPASLSKLSLTGCLLRWEDLPMIGSLPSLEVLELKRMLSYAGNRWSPVDGQFPRLKFLKLDFCDLCCWDADSYHFPVLQKLLLVDLWHLEEIPLGVGEIPTLELISVDCCSDSAAISAVRIKEDQLENQGNDVLQIQVGMHRSNVESFMRKTETEGLIIDGIHLEIYDIEV